MNIYLVRRKNEWVYDEYDNYVCVCDTESEAVALGPEEKGYCRYTWPLQPDDCAVELLGRAKDSATRGVKATSFRAG